MGEIMALVSAFCFGLSNIFASKAMAKTDRDTGLLITILVNVIISTAALLISLLYVEELVLTASGLILFILVGIIGSFLGRLLLLKSIQNIGSARTSGLKLSAPVFSILVGMLFLQEKFNVLSLIGSLVVIGGLLIIAWEAIQKEGNQPSSRQNMQGIVYGLLLGFCFGIANVFKKLGIEAIPSVFFGIWFTSIVSLIACSLMLLRRYRLRSLLNLLKNEVDINYFYMGFLTSMAHYSILFSLSLIGVGIASTLSATEALFATVLSYILLNNSEKIKISTVAGVLSVTTGVALIMFAKN